MSIILRLIKTIVLMTSLLFGWIPLSQATTGWCIPTSGTAYSFNVPFNYTANDPSQNTTGTLISPAGSWNQGGTFSITCDCDGTYRDRLFKGDTPLVEDHQSGNETFYSVNEYLAVDISVYIGGNGYHYIPFINVDNNSSDNKCNTPITTADSGSKGSLDLYFKRPFVGQQTIPNTLVASLYSSRTSGSYSSQPISQIYLSGTVTVPQSCKINDGKVIDVDFGEIYNTAFKKKGAAPDEFSANITQLQYVCTNISEGVLLSFTFTGQSATDDTNSLSTTNKDIGVRIEDMNGVTITPNSGKLPAQFDYDSQSGSTSFKSYPVNTTGNTPEVGAFSSTATIIVNIE